MHHKEKYHCGAWWVPKFIRRLLSIKFNESCLIHDLDYENEQISRKESDKKFLLNMIEQANGNFGLKSLAFSFYIFVRILGIFSWGIKK